MTKLELNDRVFETTQRQSFVTLKDHKPNFPNNPSCRLINPTKPEVGKISKQILEQINLKLRNLTGLKQWRNTDAVIKWFSSIGIKRKQKFIQFDVVNFYPSINNELLTNALNWARQYTDISDDEFNIIIQAKQSVLFKDGTPWAKKGDNNFDVGMGSYDGAETCELVGLFILSQMKDLDLDVGLYRDDGLGVTCAPPRQVEAMKKKICAIFRKNKLEITIEANKKSVNFLDITMDLESETYRPYIKPNDAPLYIHKLSNHPPSILKNIPAAVNKRLSSISSNETIFENAAPVYQEALSKSGYNVQLKFNPNSENTSKTNCRKRSRKITWFNPPYSSNVKTNVGAKFLKLVDKCFPPSNPLSKSINRNTVKFSYRCTPNIGSIISAQNAKLLKKNEEGPQKKCNCPKNTVCPLDGNCLAQGIIYQATVTETISRKSECYIGLTAPTFKARIGNHKKSFNHEKYKKETTLSKHIWDLKQDEIDYDISWKLMARAQPYSPVTGVCQLCILEKWYITFKPELATLNNRNEIFTHCRHMLSVLLDKT